MTTLMTANGNAAAAAVCVFHRKLLTEIPSMKRSAGSMAGAIMSEEIFGGECETIRNETDETVFHRGFALNLLVVYLPGVLSSETRRLRVGVCVFCFVFATADAPTNHAPTNLIRQASYLQSCVSALEAGGDAAAGVIAELEACRAMITDPRCEKRSPFFAPVYSTIYLKHSIYQDRLGTNVGKRLRRRDAFSTGRRAGTSQPTSSSSMRRTPLSQRCFRRRRPRRRSWPAVARRRRRPSPPRRSSSYVRRPTRARARRTSPRARCSV